MTNDPPADPPLRWRRAELALMFPTMVWPAALILGNGPITGFAVLLSGLFAPLIVPGRRACGWASIIVGSCYLALSILLIMVGFAVIVPPRSSSSSWASATSGPPTSCPGRSPGP